jgi:hypothetical protein
MAKKRPGSIAVIPFRMLSLQLHGVGGYRNITTVNDAAEWLPHRLPVAGGRQHLQCGLDRVRRAAAGKGIDVDDPPLAELRRWRAFERYPCRSHEARRAERLERLGATGSPPNRSVTIAFILPPRRSLAPPV